MMSKKEFVRFGIVAPDGRISGIWKIWTEKNEVYILERISGRFFKASLHKSGHWQISFTSEFFADKNVPNQERHIEKWEAPIDNIGAGFTLAFRIIIPESEMRKHTVSTNKEIKWINAPKKGHFIEIDFIFTKHSTKVNGWPGKISMNTTLLKELKLLNKDTLWVVYLYQLMDPQQIKDLNHYKGNVQKLIKNNGSGRLKMILIGDEKDGSRKFIESSLTMNDYFVI